MYSIPRSYGSCSESVNFLQGVLLMSSTATTTEGGKSSIMSSRSTAEEKAVAASKSHSEAERQRRKRINGHLATLRNLLPNTIKRDKASLLAEVVRRIRDLKKTTAELAAIGADTKSFQYHVFPTESDELNLCFCEGNTGTIKATLCCDDRPELISDLTRAVKSVAGKVVRAEMATVAGRTKSVLWIQVLGGSGGEGLGALRRALKVVLEKNSLQL